MRRRGWSLLEMVFLLAILAMMLVGGVTAFQQPTSRAGSRGLATLVAEAFRATRARAVAEQRPAALVIPSGGTQPCAQSLAYLQGEEHAGVVRVLDWHREFPDGVVCVGTYASAGSWSKDRPDIGRSRYLLTPAPGFPGSEPFRIWLGNRNDYVFLFAPDGQILTNDLPQLDGIYRLVVSQGVTTGATSVPGTGLGVSNPPPYQQISAACNPYTVSVSPVGAVQVEQGLAGGSGGTTLSRGSLPLTNVAAPLTPTVEPVTNPVLADTSFYPPAGAIAGTLSGVSGTLAPERALTMSVHANITTSDDLFCTVTCTGVRPDGTSLPPGPFSSSGIKRMQFLPAFPPLIPDGRWVSNWQWVPPPQAAPGDRFTFEVTVTTRRGGVATSSSTPGLTKTIEIYDEGRLFFGAQDPYPPNRYQIYSVRADGTDLTKVTPDEASSAQVYPAATRDGFKLLFDAVEYPISADLVGLSRGGGLSTPITFPPLNAGSAQFSDDSSVCVFDGYLTSDKHKLYTFDPDGLWPPPVTTVFDTEPPSSLAIGCAAPTISHIKPGFTTADPLPGGPMDGRRANARRIIAFESDCGPGQTGRRAIYTCNFINPGTPKPPANCNILRQTQGGPGGLGSGGDRNPAWHPTTDWLAFQSDRAGGGTEGIYLILADLSSGHTGASDGAILVSSAYNNAMYPVFSPNGTRLAYIVNDATLGWDIVTQAVDVSTSPPTLGTPIPLRLRDYTPFSLTGWQNINKACWSL